MQALFSQYGTPIHYTQANGLTTESMYSCAVDNEGFVWFASETGASRFNGHKFEHFKAIEDAANSFLYFKVDHKNRIWANTIAGDINYFENGKWCISAKNKEFKKIINKNVGTTLIGTVENIIIFQYERNILLFYDEDTALKYKYFKNIVSTKLGKTLFYKIHENKLKIYTDNENFDIDLSFMKNNKITANNPDYNRNFKTHKINFYKNNQIYDVTLIPNQNIDGDVLFHENNLYITGSKGLYKYKKINDTLFKLVEAPLLNIPCVNLAIDKRNNLWVCSQLEGVYFFPYILGKSYIYPSLKGDFFLKALPINNHYKLLSSYGKILNFKNNKFSPIRNFNTLSYDFQIYNNNEYYLTTTTLYKNNSVFFRNGHNWYKSFLIKPQSNEIFIGAGDRLFKVWPTIQKLYSNEVPDRIYRLELFQNNLLLGTDNGVFLIKDEKKVSFDLGPYASLKNISFITQAKDSSLFFLSRNLGVLLKHRNQYVLLKENSDLLGAPTCLFSPQSGIVLIGTRNGLNVVHYKSNPLSIQYIKSFTSSNGLIDSKINNISFDKSDSQILITFNNAVQILPLSSIFSKTQDSKLYFKYISSENIAYRSFENIKFKHFENNIEIGFDVIDYASENKKGFSYRLLGASEKWNDVNGNSVKFSDLEPGHYIFELKLRNQYNLNNQIITLKFIVAPAYWQTIWFKALTMLTFSFIILGLFNFRHQKIIKKEREKNILDKEHASLELEAIKAQINPHFIYNCLNSIQHSIIKNDNHSAEKQLSNFSKLVRETLDYSKTDFISLDKEITYLDRYLQMEKLRFKEKLEYSIISNIPDNENTIVPCLLIQPFVENAVKHGLSKNGNEISTIKIYFEHKGDRIECKVEDSGIGIESHILKQKDLPSGMGLSKKRAQTYNSIYNMDIQINIINKNTLKNPENGTLATINFPFKTK